MLMKTAMKDAAEGKDLTRAFRKIRQQFQQTKYFTSLSPILITVSGLLNNDGCRIIFENRAQNSDLQHPTDEFFTSLSPFFIINHHVRSTRRRRICITFENRVQRHRFPLLPTRFPPSATTKPSTNQLTTYTTKSHDIGNLGRR